MPEDSASNQPQGSPSPVPAVALPKGGGAIRGIGEKFSTNAMTGTGSLGVPLALSAARSGHSPQIAVTYDSGSGNGVFGLGWDPGLPAITRKTDKGLPQYCDFEDSDVFILSGSEDLVPIDSLRDVVRDEHEIRRFRPRVEGLFARIERWTRQRDGEVHWRTFTKDNLLTIYGATPQSRISDPDYPRHTFKWLISASYDNRGNAIVYEYAAEDMRGVEPGDPAAGRTPANRYVKRILYGNRVPLWPSQPQPGDPGWMFEAIFDYGGEDFCVFEGSDGEQNARFSEKRADWPVRRDPFSSCRAGFEIRTYRLCRRVLMLHRFPEELGARAYLVRSTEFEYEEKRTGSLLTGVVQSGYKRLDDGSYLRKNLPKLELGYSASPLEQDSPGPFDLREADATNLPSGIGAGYRWIDLDGEGISGVLSEQASGWFYKRNLGNGQFGAVEQIAPKPASAHFDATHQLLDVRGGGQLNLAALGTGGAGFYERAAGPDRAIGLESGWGPFRPFRCDPNVNWNDPNLRLVDLTGDGIADILITEDVAFRWHASLEAAGFGAAVRVPAPGDERDGPRIVFSNPEQSVYLADMSGDGLSDIVRIRNGEVCYWPNLGYGRFGAKVVMQGAPWFDARGLFDYRRIRLSDTDGSGTTDILYLTGREVRVYLNESGNSLSAAKVLKGIPAPGVDSISVVDFLGRGTACLLWSSALPGDARRPLRYVDLMRGGKPNLLTRIANNLGAETRIEYKSSTEFYLADKADGQPWLTPLPFPVHVAARVETFDAIGRTRLVARNSYHHGYYDAVEREFRGFGRVERIDTEEFDRGHASANEDQAWRIPPSLTKTWYHTGAFFGAGRISRHLAHEYYREPFEKDGILLADTILPEGVTPEESREASRALKGTKLREEVYALDGGEDSDRPYRVIESNATLRLLQHRGRNRHAILFAHAREAVTANYERKLYETGGVRRVDPRVMHAFTLKVDEYGNALRTVSIAYGRRFRDASPLLGEEDRARQAKLLATSGASRYTNAIDEPDAYRTPAIAESRTYELTDAAPPRSRLFSFEEIAALDGQHGDRRLIQAARTLYRGDSLERLLPLGRLESLELPGESYSLALTPELIARVYQAKFDDAGEVMRGAGYVELDGDGRWWIPSGRVYFSANENDDAAAELKFAREHFFLFHRYRDAFGKASQVGYDRHNLMPVETRDPLGNAVRAEVDYRVMQIRQVTDANGNRSQAAFDALGMLAGTALMGKAGEEIGDSLRDFAADLPDSVVREHLERPLENPWKILGNATSRLLYDVSAFARTRSRPAATYLMARETHVSDLAEGQRTQIHHTFSYSDGFGREIQKKMQAEPGPIPGGGTFADPRWVGSGWTIFNNKGKAVRQYEPFFTATHDFEFAVTVGVTVTQIYDPLERVAATLNPDQTFQKTVVDPWRQEAWDSNDTVLLNPGRDPDIGAFLRAIPPREYSPTWYEQRREGRLGRREQEAACKASGHANTPAVQFLDARARFSRGRAQPFPARGRGGRGVFPYEIGAGYSRQHARGDRCTGACDRHSRLRLRQSRNPSAQQR